jgi:hypothetical protein
MFARSERDQADTPETLDAPARPLEPVEAADAAGGWMARAAWLLAAAWVVGVGVSVAAMSGMGALPPLSLVQGLALAFAAFMPAALLLFAGAAVREGARAQAQARRLADAADRMLNPSPVAEAAARRLGISIRSEIAALDRSIEEALAKLASVEAVIDRQVQAVDRTAATAQQGAGHMVAGLERERTTLAAIASDLEAGAVRLGESILRQAQTIAGAARDAEGQLRAADAMLEGRLNAFGAAAQLIGDRTGMLTQAAAATDSSTGRLEGALSGALDTLAKATSLTEAARQSTDAATLAANATAGAVRDTTNRAIEDARRAADLIRAEAQNVEREAALAIERLREAATEARLAATEAREATGALPPRRSGGGARVFSFMPGGKDRTARADARREAERLEVQRFEAQVARFAGAPEDGRPRGFGEQFGPRIQARGALEEKVAAERSNSERWNWRELLRAVDPEPPQLQGREPSGRPLVTATPNEYEAPAPIRRGPPTQPASAPASPTRLTESGPGMVPVAPRAGPGPVFALQAGTPFITQRRSAEPLFEKPAPPAPGRSSQMLAAIGVNVAETFSPAALDRIAARARNGTQARRRAVRDAAPEAVLRLTERFETDPRAREEASRFLESEGARLADLLGRGRASMSADATRAFLLIDAASS